MPAPAPTAIREVVLTRPEGSNAELRAAIDAARPADFDGNTPILTTLPLLVVRPLPGGGELSEALAAMQPDDLVVFVSPRAVAAASTARPLTDWPARHVAAVGAATGRALAEAGCTDAVLPDGSEDSEGLLERLDGLSMRGRRVWIIRGETGRELLAETLAARGARPQFVAVYRRECAATPERVPTGADRLWIVTAPQALDCLAARATAMATAAPPTTDGRPSGLLDSTLLVINERARDRARTLGFRGTIVLAGGPAPATLAEAAWNLIIERQSSSRTRP